MNEKRTPIERALVAAAGMPAPEARNVLMLICQGGQVTGPATPISAEGEAHYERRRKFINRFKLAIDQCLNYARHETLRNVNKHFRDNPTYLAAAEEQPKTLSAQLTFDRKLFSEELLAALAEEQAAALRRAGQGLFDEIGMDDPFRLPDKQALAFIQERENLLSKVPDELHREIMDSIEQGLEHGESKKELMVRIGTAFDGISRGRADTIANTETAAAFNFARDKAMRKAGVSHKKWLLSQSPLIKEHRPTHIETNGQVQPVDEPFDVQGIRMMHPGDDSLGAGPEDIINCHCVAIPVEAPIESGDLPGHEFHGNQYTKHSAEMSLEEVKQMAEEFQQLRKERNKLASWPAYEIRMKELHGEEYTSDIRTRFARLRDKIISEFGIEGTKYDKFAAGEKYLDSQQVAERSFGVDTAAAFHKRAKILHEKVKKGQ